MTDKETEKLFNLIERQQREIERLQAVNEIQNLIGRYAFVHSAWRPMEEVELFAQHTPGVTYEVDGIGRWDGIEKFRAYSSFRAKREAKDLLGLLPMHTMTTAVIEVAEDGETAKGVWISPGFETGTVPGGELTAVWMWNKYACDFVQEDGKWKIWHFHIYPIFRCSYYKSWVDDLWLEAPSMANAPEEMKPTVVSTEWHPWSPTALPEKRPAPPEPYKTWKA